MCLNFLIKKTGLNFQKKSLVANFLNSKIIKKYQEGFSCFAYFKDTIKMMKNAYITF